MQGIGSRILFISLSISAVVLLTACNVGGFFTDLNDDPVWVDPNAAASATASAEVGGPGKGVYGRTCAACHLGSGKGVPGNNIPSLVGSDFANGDATVPIRIVLHGFRGPIVRNGVSINGQMASWKDLLSDQEIADVLTYVRSTFGNTGTAVTLDEVKTVREATASRTQAFSEAELQ